MQTFREWLWIENKRLIPLENVKQQTDFSCGAAALRSIAQFYGVGPDSEREFIKACDSGKRKGTHPEDIVRVARQFNLNVEIVKHMTIKKLIEQLKLKRPVICAVQAWGDPEDYHKLEDGHYIVALGFDDKNIYFNDPSLRNAKGFLPFDEFNERWYDKEAYTRDYAPHLGLIIWSDRQPVKSHHEPKEKKIL